MTDPFGQVRSRSRQLAVMVSVTVIGYMTGSCGHGHATTAGVRAATEIQERGLENSVQDLKEMSKVYFFRHNEISGMDQGSEFECEFRDRRIRVRGNFAHKSLTSEIIHSSPGRCTPVRDARL
jgi:hypothetical protein